MIFVNHANNPANNYLFKINNGNTISNMWNMFQVNINDNINVVLVSLRLIFNIFHTYLALSSVSTFEFEQILVYWINLSINKPIQNIQESEIQKSRNI